MRKSLEVLMATRGGDVFVPFVFRLALRLEQVSWGEACEDAPLAAHALGTAQRMFRTDACANWFDTGLEAQAAGATLTRDAFGDILASNAAPADLPGPDAFLATPVIRHALAVTRQLCEMVPAQACVLGCLTGPATLLARLFGAAPEAEERAAEHARAERAASLATALARAYCELGVGGLALLEDAVPQFAEVAGAFDALFNLASYYAVPVVVVSRAPMAPAMFDTYAQLGAGYVVAPGTRDTRVAAVAPEALSAGAEGLSQPAEAGRLVATTWEVRADTSPEALGQFGARLKR